MLSIKHLFNSPSPGGDGGDDDDVDDDDDDDDGDGDDDDDVDDDAGDDDDDEMIMMTTVMMIVMMKMTMMMPFRAVQLRMLSCNLQHVISFLLQPKCQLSLKSILHVRMTILLPLAKYRF